MKDEEMTDEEKVKLWLFIEDRLAEDEAKRVEALSDEQLDAEMRAAGWDREKIITFEEVLARAQAKLERAKLKPKG